MSSATCYAWKAKFGSLEVSDAKRLRALKEGTLGSNGYARIRPQHKLMFQPLEPAWGFGLSRDMGGSGYRRLTRGRRRQATLRLCPQGDGLGQTRGGWMVHCRGYRGRYCWDLTGLWRLHPRQIEHGSGHGTSRTRPCHTAGLSRLVQSFGRIDMPRLALRTTEPNGSPQPQPPKASP